LPPAGKNKSAICLAKIVSIRYVCEANDVCRVQNEAVLLPLGKKQPSCPEGLARFLTAASELFLRFKNRAKRTYGATLQPDYKSNRAKIRKKLQSFTCCTE
jgi:hypothetical protein